MFRRTVSTAVLAVLIVIAACAPNTAPTLTIDSPADGSSVVEGTMVTLSATATDAQQGDLTSAIDWTSDIDGALSPDANDEVLLSVGTHTITATVADLQGLTATDSVEVSVTEGIATHLASDGIAIKLLAIVEDQVEEVASASIPDAGLLAGHRIFNAVFHPTLPLVYVGSSNECSGSPDWCWGNARIDTFQVIGDVITHVGAFVEDASQLEMTCAQEDWGFDGQVGACTPGGMVFSSDGTRLYVDDDQLDGIHVFAVDAGGVLTFLGEGGSTVIHGLAIDPTDTYLYNGERVIDVTGDLPTDLTPVQARGGNSTALVAVTGSPGLLTTIFTDTIGVFDLADPLVPASVDELPLGPNQARDLDFLPSLERIVAVGRNGVHAVSFAAGALSLDDTYVPPEVTNTEYRSVMLAQGGTRAIAGWFTTDTPEQPGGVDLLSVAADGTLARLERVAFDGGSRLVMGLP